MSKILFQNQKYLTLSFDVYLNWTFRCKLIIRILRPNDWLPSDFNRLIWCLYIPDDNEDDATVEDVSSLLVVTHNERVKNICYSLFVFTSFLMYIVHAS